MVRFSCISKGNVNIEGVKMRIQPVRGTRDFLPEETRLRDYLQEKILHTYVQNGFERILTPALEDVENLDKSEGGDNLNLIFKILKRGEKLERAVEESDVDELADIGLRYDLTLPLCRYYANNKAHLSLPFKVIQLDRVYRAERPQRGRMREFVQCDIDILGSDSHECEIELIYVMAKTLLAIGMKNLVVRINDRRLHNELLTKLGFSEEEHSSVSITLDKLDKIGLEGVREELLEKECSEEAIDAYSQMLESKEPALEKVKSIVGEHEALLSLESIIKASERLSGGKYTIEYDLSLIRGQGYYTGTVFEIETPDFPGSIAGGGRYDKLIEKFIDEDVPAVGFSIGFERIFSILSEAGFVIPEEKQRIAVIYDAGMITEAISGAEELRDKYEVTLFERPKKVGRLFNRLEERGFSGFVYADNPDNLRLFEK